MDCVSISLCGPFSCFFSPSPATESPLSLRRLRFMVQSIASFSWVFFSLFFSLISLLFFVVVVDDDGFFAVVVVTVLTVDTLVAVIVLAICFLLF